MKIKNPALFLYFIAYVLYLYFFKINIDKEVALIFKPMILASISFYYFFNSQQIKKNKLHFFIIGLLFVADNANLLQETVFYQLALFLYMVVLFLFLYLILLDSKLLHKKVLIEKRLGLVFGTLIFAAFVLKIISLYVVKHSFHSYYLIINYIIVFLSVLVFSLYNYFKFKTTSSKFLLLTMLSLLFADLTSVINVYYYKAPSLNYFSCIAEIPCYYFLVRYFLARDVEKNNVII